MLYIFSAHAPTHPTQVLVVCAPHTTQREYPYPSILYAPHIRLRARSEPFANSYMVPCTWNCVCVLIRPYPH